MDTKTPRPLPAIRDAVHHLLYQQGRGMRHASMRMGKSANYLTQALKGENPRISMLLELSREININLLNLYLPLLPDAIRPTPTEQALRQENEALRAELEKVKEENARLWGVIEKRG